MNTTLSIAESFPNEEWRYVEEFESIYAVSNQGRLASNKTGSWRILSNVNAKRRLPVCSLTISRTSKIYTFA